MAKDYSKLDYPSLVNICRSSNPVKSNLAFNVILQRMKGLLLKYSSRYKILGMTHDDIFQEACIALRFKAIKDYDKDRGDGSGPFPFDVFAKMCINRHLTTKSKITFQDRNSIYRKACSYDRNEDYAGNAFDEMRLKDTLAERNTITTLDAMADNERTHEMVSKLRLSAFEKLVLSHFLHKQSYEDIRNKINATLPADEQVTCKMVDNAICRCKAKGRKIKAKYDIAAECTLD